MIRTKNIKHSNTTCLTITRNEISQNKVTKQKHIKLQKFKIVTKENYLLQSETNVEFENKLKKKTMNPRLTVKKRESWRYLGSNVNKNVKYWKVRLILIAKCLCMLSCERGGGFPSRQRGEKGVWPFGKKLLGGGDQFTDSRIVVPRRRGSRTEVRYYHNDFSC